MKILHFLTILTSFTLLLSVNSAFAGLSHSKSFLLNDVQNAFVSQTEKDTIVTVNSIGQVKLLRLSDLSEVRSFSITKDSDELISRVQSIPGSSYILVEKDYGSIELWNSVEGKLVRQLTTVENPFGWSNYSLQISGDGKHIFLIGEARKGIDVFDLNGGYFRLNPPINGLGNLVSSTGFIVSNDMKTLWLRGGGVASYDLTDGHLITQYFATPRPLFLSPKEDILVIPLMWSEGVTPKAGLSFYFTNQSWHGREYTRTQISPKTTWANEPTSVVFDADSRNLISSDGVGVALFNQTGQSLGDYQTFDFSNFKPPYNFLHLDKIEFFDQGKQVFTSIHKTDQKLMLVTIYLVD